MTDTDDLAAQLIDLHRKNPQSYGQLVRYWDDAKEGLDNTSRNYASVGQIFENIRDPECSTRTLGQTLTLLTTLDVIRIQTNRSNATIYDLTTYQPDRLCEISRLLNGM